MTRSGGWTSLPPQLSQLCSAYPTSYIIRLINHLIYLQIMSNEPIDDHAPSENTPLLGNNQTNGHLDPEPSEEPDTSSSKKSRLRWPSIVALFALTLLAILIMLLGFFVPDAMQKYAVQATTVDILSVVPEFTDTGARAKVKVSFSLQSQKVKDKNVRNLGVLGTWIAREVESGESRIDVHLPEYGDAILGTAVVPPLKVSIVNGRTTDLDFHTDLIPPTNIDPLRLLFDDWVKGTLDHVKVAGDVKVALRSGIIRLPTQNIFQSITVHGM
jgi:hypothetical protein